MDLEALCKQHAEATQKLREEKATLELMVESCDELIMEITDEFGYKHVDEDAEDKEDDSEEDDHNDGGDAAATPAAAPPLVAAPPTIASEVIIVDEEEEDPMEMVPE
jgi:hypothetical protein